MVETQRGVCLICEEAESAPDKSTRKTKDLAVDHCHATNRIRGLLCSNCNIALGLFKDDPALLIRAAAYLRA
jgi:hypothetical protein